MQNFWISTYNLTNKLINPFTLHRADVTPPKVQLKTMVPVISDDGIALTWSFDEEAVTICELHPPSMLNKTTVPCSNNAVLLPYATEGYILSIQGTDMGGNVAEPVQLTWSVCKQSLSYIHTMS